MNFDIDELTNEKRQIHYSIGLPLVYVGFELHKTDFIKFEHESVELVKEYFDDLENNYKKRKGIFLQGNFGSGKTTIATIIMKRLYEIANQKAAEMTKKTNNIPIEKLPQIRFLTGYDVADISSKYNLSERQLRLRSFLYEFAILCIDDFDGIAGRTENELLFIENLIRKRFLTHKMTLFTSNTRLDDYDKISKSIVDIINQNTLIVELPEINFRR